ncbi:hypothetical protein BJ170DRAFT_704392 [Xylariales sp. AK1849]|nr:hypothetical protein BJ170DRAFT_704392 [Xylariales sp. AK1849]
MDIDDNSAGLYSRTIRTRTEEQRQADANKIKKYRELEDDIRLQIKQQSYNSPALLDLTTKLLRLNPEYYTIWNVRRRCLISGSLSRQSGGSWRSRESQNTSASDTTRPSSDDYSHSRSDATPPDRRSLPVQKGGKSEGDTAAPDPEQAQKDTAKDAELLEAELQFTIPLLLEFPKCYWIWSHRRFLLTLCISRLTTALARQIWTTELALTSKMLTKDRRNFHAWSYRKRVVSTLESSELEGASMAESEFEYTTRMIRRDLSNFSAWHSRSNLVLRILDERGADDEARKHFLEEELALAREGLNVGPEDQSLWYYHQFLMSHLTDWVGRRTIAPGLTVAERITYVEKEIEEIRELGEDYKDVKWIYEALLEYTMALGPMGSDGVSKDEMEGWLQKLRELDLMRKGRWDDVEKALLGK